MANKALPELKGAGFDSESRRVDQRDSFAGSEAVVRDREHRDQERRVVSDSAESICLRNEHILRICRKNPGFRTYSLAVFWALFWRDSEYHAR